MTFFGQTFSIGGTDITYGVVRHARAVSRSPGSCSPRPPGAATSTRSATTPRRRACSGIRLDRLLITVYSSPALIYGIAALLLVARTQVGDPNAGQTDNLDSITAVVLGGTSLFGGRGNVIGTLIGALIVGVFRNGLVADRRRRRSTRS